MKDTLIAHIWDENNRLQSLQPADEPASMEASYERLQKLVWDLKQTDYKATALHRVWPRLVRIGNYELRKMHNQHQQMLRSPSEVAERTNYVNSHGQLREKSIRPFCCFSILSLSKRTELILGVFVEKGSLTLPVTA